VEHPNQVFDHNQIQSYFWDYGYIGGDITGVFHPTHEIHGGDRYETQKN
jgi:hypothetical protein